ncbi:uncharacterized protein LOC106181521 isoform X2 [Lingula anatina]|uniref:Uncharacterized protein LOC106181521 isoform X1 n=1 Tax=Lingula anatina TaxID=7574 RepID=A0A1S3KFW6_LINAN|nr:uncharacterized protein LOC106181521 isoform X1 [Lingula anatina]XP_013421381.1 uncharacterized protein LOC106181521 isoform X1 [Lingula anatina]XP_013421382.1 uncharacterized protein LOC106181521 isoform X1 [Lingula anatina]XP_013421383.1 uncharacterized protein LOC106181521 isoform X1 [Lingula anatina]XP_013421384.1 uncharacterized protein LOC106181521 isoform X1 [Lingula anatina]XP_023931853.1 uncharacterized protein LOC106181521 isoform X2 [Lingula anatina]|eukprot:XP_013421379.1 uncharacterized protein LOC106181521 isoform X1 [Lingula anatina]
MDSPEPQDDDLKDELELDELCSSMPQPETEGEDLAEQLTELQSMMLELKDGFVHAMEELSKIQNGDTAVQERYEASKVEQEKQLQDIKDMVNSLKDQFQSVSSQVITANENQTHLRHQVDRLQQEREVLLQELERSGAISNQLRQKFGNGLHSSDANHVTSDHDSGVATTYRPDVSSHGDATPPMISPMVRPFIAGLQNANRPEDNFEENYDSDSSLIEAANKSLNLSRSLGQKCLDVDPSNSSDGSDNEKENVSSAQGFSSPMNRHKSSFSPKKLPPHELSIRETQRSRVARELLETERKYCSSLWTIVDTYCQPIKQSGCTGAKDISLMFPSSVSRLYSLHCNLLHKLEEKLLNWKWQCGIGDVFSRFTETNSELLGTYKIYVHDFPTAIGTINKWYRQSSRFRKVLKTCQKQPSCEGLDLTAFLLTPIQRIPRYVLLLKQLRKYTDPEHPDYYYLESALDCLGHFLAQLNNSIEHSMQLVGLDGGGAKQHRKQRNAASLRRSSSSSHDGFPLSGTTRDSGVHSVVDTHGGRRYQLSVFKNPGRQVGHQSDSSDFAMDPHSIPVPRDKHKSSHHMNGGTASRDSTFSHDGPNYIKNKNRDKPRKSKSKKGHRNELSFEALSTSNGTRFHAAEGEDYGSNGRNRRKNLRSKSMAEQISETSYRSRLAEGGEEDYGEAGTARKKPHRSKSSTRPASDYLSISMRDLVGETSEGSLDMEKMAPDGASFHRSLPRLPKDYGIYGEDDSVIDEPAYMPSMATKDVPTRKAQKLGLIQKSKSHGDFLQEDAASPTQSHLNIVLARSLTEAHVNNIGESGIITDGEASPSPLRKHSMQVNRTAMVSQQEFPDRVRENVWNDDPEQSYVPRDPSLVKEEKGRRRKLKEKRKDRQKQVVENLASRPVSGGGLKKKRSLRDSLRNIFFRKRGNSSKVVEIDPLGQTVDLSYLNQSGSFEEPDNGESYEFSRTFEDENGDPCSAV